MRKCTKIICFSGSDSVGKSTQCKLLKSFLEANGNSVALVKSPYKDGLTYDIIYKMLESGLALKHPNLFQCVQYLNKVLFQVYFKKRYEHLDYVIIDRWKLSMVVYGDASGANKNLTRTFYKTLFTPDFTVLLVGDAFKRSSRQEDSYEKDKRLQDNVKREYVDWSKSTRDKFVLIDPQLGKEVVHKKIVLSLFDNELLKRKE